MSLGALQFTCSDRKGNAVAGASVKVYDESTGLLADIYSDRAGSSVLGNPFFADADGYAIFYAAVGEYRVVIAGNGYTRTLRYVPIAFGSINPGLSWEGAWQTATAYVANDAVENDGSSYVCTSAHTSGAGTEPGTGGSWATVWDLLAAKGTNGTGVGDVVGPASATNNAIALFDGTTGELLKDSATTIDTDGTLAANSDARLASQKAVKTYVDGIIAAQDAMVFKGVIDCSANPNYPAAARGDTYRVSVAGKIGGGSGPNVEVGDIIICGTDATSSGNHATVGANWGIIQVNIDGALTTASIGASVQAYSARLTDIAALAITDGNIIVGNGTTWVAESGATARTSLGLGTGDSPQLTGIELGHATDTTISRLSSGVPGVEGVALLKANGNATLTGGFRQTSYNIGTVSSGTTTPDAYNGNFQYMTNNGAHTIAVPANDCAIDILVTNGASAGTITFSGYTVPSGGTGDTYATTNTNKYILSIRRINGTTTYSWDALQ